MEKIPEVPAWGTIMRLSYPANTESAEELRHIAKVLENGHHYLAAGQVMECAARAAWGNPNAMGTAAIDAWNHYRRVLASETRCSIRGLTALLLASRFLRLDFLPPGSVEPTQSDQLDQELAQRLVACFADDADRNIYLVRGAIVETDLFEKFDVREAVRETDGSATVCTPDSLQFGLPSAFTLLRYLGDYVLAKELIDLCPGGFTTPGLRGWRAAVRGLNDPASAPEHFAEASEAFAEDRLPQRTGAATGPDCQWDNMNVDTWAPYFRVRSLLALAVREPQRVRELIARAAQAADPEAGGRAAPNVRRLALLVRALAGLLSSDATIDVSKIREEFRMVSLLGRANDGDDIAVKSLALAAEAFDGFRQAPEAEMTQGRLRAALDGLRRVPFLDSGVSAAIEPAFGEQATKLRDGPIRTWVHRALGKITDERKLHKIILRLSQASLPLYAQVLHGPLEYGKDVVVHFEREGRRVLRMYQAKAGDISLPEWRGMRAQLEDMFLVPMPDFAVPAGPELDREGVLWCNGHAKSSAVPAMEGWFEEQRRTRGWNLRFMNLDEIVRWIFAERLVNELRTVFDELGIDIGN